MIAHTSEEEPSDKQGTHVVPRYLCSKWAKIMINTSITDMDTDIDETTSKPGLAKD
jgi:hypothetical protein